MDMDPIYRDYNNGYTFLDRGYFINIQHHAIFLFCAGVSCTKAQHAVGDQVSAFAAGDPDSDLFLRVQGGVLPRRLRLVSGCSAADHATRILARGYLRLGAVLFQGAGIHLYTVSAVMHRAS